MEGRALTASVVITTKDRKEEVVNALESAFAQSVPVEVVVAAELANVFGA